MVGTRSRPRGGCAVHHPNNRRATEVGSPYVPPLKNHKKSAPPLDSLYFRYRIGVMSILQRAVQVVTDAEVAMRRLIAEAAECGEYSAVEALARWANVLGALCAKEQQAA